LNLILFGPPGAGKGTQAKLLAQRRGLPQLSTGEMLRAAIASGSALGRRVESVLAKGDLVSDSIVIDIIKDRLQSDDCFKGAVFDGFPRTIAQAEALDRLLSALDRSIDLVIELKVDDERLLDRVRQRIVEGHSRPDDNPDTLRNRLKVYHRQTAPLIDHYSTQTKLVSVDGMRSIEDVSHAIGSAIDGSVAMKSSGRRLRSSRT